LSRPPVLEIPRKINFGRFFQKGKSVENSNNQIATLLVGIAVAAAMLGIAPKTLRNWLHMRRSPVPHVKLGTRTVFRVSDLHAFVDGLAPAASVSATVIPTKRLPGRPRNSKRRAG
jgi:hypothetical protein